MKTTKITALVLAGGISLSMFAAVASAKDDVLIQDMVTLDQKYIKPLFMTNQSPQKARETIGSFKIYLAEWWGLDEETGMWKTPDGFYYTYKDYRPTYTNWTSYFESMDAAVEAARKIVHSCGQNLDQQTNTCYTGTIGEADYMEVNLRAAHEHLEHVRETMRELRIHNGFPQFITDKLTAFHGPMEDEIVVPLKRIEDLSLIDENMIASLSDSLDSAYFMWKKVEKCPVDMEMWGFSDFEMAEYEKLLAGVREALDDFSVALKSGDAVEIKATSMPIQKAFVPVILFFGKMLPFQQ